MKLQKTFIIYIILRLTYYDNNHRALGATNEYMVEYYFESNANAFVCELTFLKSSLT